SSQPRATLPRRPPGVTWASHTHTTLDGDDVAPSYRRARLLRWRPSARREPYFGAHPTVCTDSASQWKFGRLPRGAPRLAQNVVRPPGAATPGSLTHRPPPRRRLRVWACFGAVCSAVTKP